MRVCSGAHMQRSWTACGRAAASRISSPARTVSGERLDQLSGIAAILRFPLPDLEDAELDPEDLQQ